MQRDDDLGDNERTEDAIDERNGQPHADRAEAEEQKRRVGPDVASEIRVARFGPALERAQSKRRHPAAGNVKERREERACPDRSGHYADTGAAWQIGARTPDIEVQGHARRQAEHAQPHPSPRGGAACRRYPHARKLHQRPLMFMRFLRRALPEPHAAAARVAGHAARQRDGFGVVHGAPLCPMPC